MDKNNTPLVNYLNYYRTLQNPGFAVLVTGKWGVGKTFQVKSVLKDEMCYVSLYGLASAKEIHDAVYFSCFKYLKSAKKIKGDLKIDEVITECLADHKTQTGLVIRAVGVLVNWFHNIRFEKISRGKILIFDDLERSPLIGVANKELFGCINSYIEHYGFRVVIICHDESVSNDLLTAKEKIIGHQIQVCANVEDAIESFIDLIQSDRERDFLKQHKVFILKIWNESKVSSLRILKYSINDICRLYSCIHADDEDLKDGEFIESLLNVFFPLCIEVYSGEIRYEDFEKIQGAVYSNLGIGNTSAEGMHISRVLSKYKNFDKTEWILDCGTLADLLVHGVYVSEVIQKQIKNYLDSKRPSKLSPWEILLRFRDEGDDNIQLAIELLQKQVDSYEILNINEFIHVAALLLFMADTGQIDSTVQDQFLRCENYVSWMANDCLIPLDYKIGFSGATHFLETFSYKNFAVLYSEGSKKKLEELIDFIFKQIDIEIKRVCEQSSSLFLFKSNLSEFLLNINADHGKWKLLPILSGIKVNEFLDVWYSYSYKYWDDIRGALENRYVVVRNRDELASERPWFKKLIDEQDRRSNKEIGFNKRRQQLARLRINCNI